jgi:hypothetical protein
VDKINSYWLELIQGWIITATDKETRVCMEAAWRWVDVHRMLEDKEDGLSGTSGLRHAQSMYHCTCWPTVTPMIVIMNSVLSLYLFQENKSYGSKKPFAFIPWCTRSSVRHNNCFELIEKDWNWLNLIGTGSDGFVTVSDKLELVRSGLKYCCSFKVELVEIYRKWFKWFMSCPLLIQSWRILVPYIPSMSMMVIGHSLLN